MHKFGIFALLLVCANVQAFWQQRKSNQLSKPASYLGQYSQIGSRGEDVLRPIPLTSTIGMEQASIDFVDGTNLRLSSQFALTDNGMDSYGVVGKLVARARKTVNTPMLENPSGLEVT